MLEEPPLTNTTSTPLEAIPAVPRPVRAEHVVMAGSILALVVLVVLPLTFLVCCRLTADGGLTLAHFRDALSSVPAKPFDSSCWSTTLPVAPSGIA